MNFKRNLTIGYIKDLAKIDPTFICMQKSFISNMCILKCEKEIIIFFLAKKFKKIAFKLKMQNKCSL